MRVNMLGLWHCTLNTRCNYFFFCFCGLFPLLFLALWSHALLIYCLNLHCKLWLRVGLWPLLILFNKTPCTLITWTRLQGCKLTVKDGFGHSTIPEIFIDAIICSFSAIIFVLDASWGDLPAGMYQRKHQPHQRKCLQKWKWIFYRESHSIL